MPKTNSRRQTAKFTVDFNCLDGDNVQNVQMQFFFNCYSMMTDLNSLSPTGKRGLKIKITFTEINNLNFVVSAGQRKFLTEMSCACFFKCIIRSWRNTWLVKLVIKFIGKRRRLNETNLNPPSNIKKNHTRSSFSKYLYAVFIECLPAIKCIMGKC